MIHPNHNWYPFITIGINSLFFAEFKNFIVKLLARKSKVSKGKKKIGQMEDFMEVV